MIINGYELDPLKRLFNSSYALNNFNLRAISSNQR